MAKDHKTKQIPAEQKYAQLFSVDQQAFKEIETILKKMGIDHDFIFVSSLVDEFFNAFKFVYENNKSDIFSKQWMKRWEFAKKYIKKYPLDFPAQKVPLKGYSKKYPILIAFSRPVPSHCEFLYSSRVLFYKSICDEEIDPASTKSLGIAEQLRLCSSLSDPRSSFIKKLRYTDTKITYKSYLDNVSKYLKDQFANGNLSESESILVKKLEPLFNYHLSVKIKTKIKGVTNTTTNLKKKDSNFINLHDTDEGFDISPIQGEIFEQNRFSYSENEIDYLDSAFKAVITNEHAAFESNDITNLNRSLRWIHNTRSISTSSPRRLNRIERSIFLDKLSASVEKEIKCAIFAIYLLGISFDDFWNLEFGRHLNGKNVNKFTKIMPQLDHAYKPGKKISSNFEKKFEILELEIPEPLNQLIKDLYSKGNRRISDSYKTNKIKTKQKVLDVIEEWRKDGLDRLHYRRITAALKTELMIQTNDPVIAHLLSGNKIQLAPTLRFYRPTSKILLEESWDMAMKNLLLEPN